MYCANCGKTFSKHEPITYTVMPGWSKPVPTCYHDRLCYARHKVLLAVVIMPVVVKPARSVTRKHKAINERGLAKYCRRYEFKGR